MLCFFTQTTLVCFENYSAKQACVSKYLDVELIQKVQVVPVTAYKHFRITLWCEVCIYLEISQKSFTNLTLKQLISVAQHELLTYEFCTF